jgi:CubicO group peptidase (beta-lactamase class C family)
MSTIETIFKQKKIEFDIPCVSYAVIQNGGVVSADTLAEDDDHRSVFQACSLSKVLTALMVLKVVQENNIDINMPVSQHITSWKIPESTFAQVSIRQCLDMTSGLGYGDRKTACSGFPQSALKIPTLLDVLTGSLPAINDAVRQLTSPGSCYAYSGAGYMVLQQWLEDFTGQNFSQLMTNQLLEPLGMADSHFSSPIDECLKTHVVRGCTEWQYMPTTASGGMWTTSHDVAQLLIAISAAYREESGAFLSKILIDEMLTPNQFNYGLGVTIDSSDKHILLAKNGQNNAHHHEIILFPSLGSGLVVMTNHAGAMPFLESVTGAIAQYFQWPLHAFSFDELGTRSAKTELPRIQT